MTDNNLKTVNWIIRIKTPQMERTETFDATDYPDIKQENNTAWVTARDALVDDLLQELAEDKAFNLMAENARILLCDANPDEPVQIMFGDIIISILPNINKTIF